MMKKNTNLKISLNFKGLSLEATNLSSGEVGRLLCLIGSFVVIGLLLAVCCFAQGLIRLRELIRSTVF